MSLATPALSRLVQRSRPALVVEPASEPERCDLCAVPVHESHRHLFDVATRQVLCACTACRILFDRPAAGGKHLALIPERRLQVVDFDLDDVQWDHLRIPVNVAFFSYSSIAQRVVAMYPGTLGAAESALGLETWQELERANPIVSRLAPDVEALLVYRAGAEHQHFIVPIDDCYRLTGIIRTQWKGFTGGKQVWRDIETFFQDLSRRAVATTQRS
jgi:hypothetical protein